MHAYTDDFQVCISSRSQSLELQAHIPKCHQIVITGVSELLAQDWTQRASIPKSVQSPFYCNKCQSHSSKAKTKTLESLLMPLLLSYLISKPSGNSVGFIFKIYPDSTISYYWAAVPGVSQHHLSPGFLQESPNLVSLHFPLQSEWSLQNWSQLMTFFYAKPSASYSSIQNKTTHGLKI